MLCISMGTFVYHARITNSLHFYGYSDLYFVRVIDCYLRSVSSGTRAAQPYTMALVEEELPGVNKGADDWGRVVECCLL